MTQPTAIFAFLCVIIISSVCYVANVKRFSLSNDIHRQLINMSNSDDCPDSSPVTGTATSGKMFQGVKVAAYNGARKFSDVLDSTGLDQFKYSTKYKPSGLICDKWGVVTTIHKSTAAIERQSKLPGWCLLIVGDKNGPQQYSIDSANAVYLNVKKQQELETYFPMLKLLPWNHFGRKNVGYIYAIAHGARVIWDFNDDNILISKHHVFQIPGVPMNLSHINATGTVSPMKTSHHEALLKYDHTTFTGNEPVYESNTVDEVLVVNSFPLLGANIAPSWPRGFPLELIKSKNTVQISRPQFVKLKAKEVGVIHYLSNHDPDCDSIYKLTQPLPLDFPMRGMAPLVVPTHGYVPFNTQSTLFLYDSFWALLLPITVHSKVSDIFRAFNETPLLKKVYKLLQQLDAWKYSAPRGSGDSDAPSKTNDSTSSGDVSAQTRDGNHTAENNSNKDVGNHTSISITQPVARVLAATPEAASTTPATSTKPTTSTTPTPPSKPTAAGSTKAAAAATAAATTTTTTKPTTPAATTAASSSLISEMEEIQIFLYEHGYIELADVELMQAWVVTLINIGYKFPEPVASAVVTASVGKK